MKSLSTCRFGAPALCFLILEPDVIILVWFDDWKQIIHITAIKIHEIYSSVCDSLVRNIKIWQSTNCCWGRNEKTIKATPNLSNCFEQHSKPKFWPAHGTWDSRDNHIITQNCRKHEHFCTTRIKKSLKWDCSLGKMHDVQGQTWQAHIVTEIVILAQRCSKISGNNVWWDLKQMLKDPILQCGHLFVEAQQYTVFLDPSGVPSVSLHLDCRVGAPPSPLLLHPTIGHRHQGKLRL